MTALRRAMYVLGGSTTAMLIVLAAAATLSAQNTVPAGAVAVSGDVPSPFTLTPADLKAMPRTHVEVKSNDGARMIAYDGVLIGDVLRRAGAPLGESLKGNAVASYVLAVGSDGYQAVFSLGELDPAMTSNDIIVADTVDGAPLSAEQGPMRVLAPKDARGARSVRMLQRLVVVRLAK